MEILEVIFDQYIPAITGGVFGIITAWVTQRVLNKRGTFSYFVNHSRIGLSTNDAIFGAVQVSWNGHSIPNLYLSVVELTNESLNDYENVIVNAHTNNTQLLSEQTQLLDSPNVLMWSEKYKQQIHLEPEVAPTDTQKKIYFGQREYVIPVFNRGEKVRLTFLNSAHGEELPSIWLSVSIVGVKLKFQPPQNLTLGVPQPLAMLAGVLIGISFIYLMNCFVDNQIVLIILAFTFGLIAQIPGALAIKLFRKGKEIIGG